MFVRGHTTLSVRLVAWFNALSYQVKTTFDTD